MDEPELQEQLGLDAEPQEEASGEQPEARETQPDFKSLYEAEKQRAEEVAKRTAVYESELQRIRADEEWQAVQQRRAQEEAQANAAIAEYQAKVEEVESLKALASQQAAAGDKSSAQATWNKAIKKQHKLEDSMVEAKLAPILQALPQVIESRVLEMLKPNLLGQYLQSSLGEEVPGIGARTAQFRSLLASGRVDDNSLAEFVKDIVGMKKEAASKQRLQVVPRGGLGMEGVDDLRMSTEDRAAEDKEVKRMIKKLAGL